MASSSGEVASGPDQKRLDSKELPSICSLGKGLSGFIYETKWKGTKYARKDFPLGSEECNSVFKDEVKSLFALDDPNIVKCFGYTVGDSSCSLLLEYVDSNLQNTIQRSIEAQRTKNSADSSGTLRLRIVDVDEVKGLLSSIEENRKITGVDEGTSKTLGRSNIPFEVPEAVNIISQIVAGMKYLHDNRVVHGDLKPKNVLLSSESGSVKVKLADFGLVETKKRIKLVSKRTQHFEILMWKAPEQFEELLGPLAKDLDDPFTDSDTDDEDVRFVGHGDDKFKILAMSDVYSFGLTCSHILGGKLLCPNLSLTQLREQRMHIGLKPEMLSATCPDFLRNLICSCLDFHPLSRPTFSHISSTFFKALQPLPPRQLMKEILTTAAKIGEPAFYLWAKNPAEHVLNTSPFYHGWKAEGTNALGEITTSVFHNNWNAKATNANGEKAEAEYTILHPSGGKAYFHLLLDASGSLSAKVKTRDRNGDRKRVYHYLLTNFEQLVEGGDTLLPEDMIYVWTFNSWKTTLLCRVKKKNFHAQLENIRAAYFTEIEDDNYKGTRMYDAIATVMKRIGEQYMAHKKADFFLVPFTDGIDHGSQSTFLNGMMDYINGIGGRLHTIFITANMPPDSEFYKRLQILKHEIMLIDCEKTEPNEISRAFDTLRELIKFLLDRRAGESFMTREADYGANEPDAAERMMFTLQSLSRETSILDGLSQMRSSIGYVPEMGDRSIGAGYRSIGKRWLETKKVSRSIGEGRVEMRRSIGQGRVEMRGGVSSQEDCSTHVSEGDDDARKRKGSYLNDTSTKRSNLAVKNKDKERSIPDTPHYDSSEYEMILPGGNVRDKSKNQGRASDDYDDAVRVSGRRATIGLEEINRGARVRESDDPPRGRYGEKEKQSDRRLSAPLSKDDIMEGRQSPKYPSQSDRSDRRRLSDIPAGYDDDKPSRFGNPKVAVQASRDDEYSPNARPQRDRSDRPRKSDISLRYDDDKPPPRFINVGKQTTLDDDLRSGRSSPGFKGEQPQRCDEPLQATPRPRSNLQSVKTDPTLPKTPKASATEHRKSQSVSDGQPQSKPTPFMPPPDLDILIQMFGKLK
ncbi:hypothetical protein KC19_11G063600 [Ceratodon purpureus]|uniref:Protein kinase domain-containing protein n=1 Tax=Ceratodon purpureus TaxID=3225 RepID=A0A8T0GBL9_CERPU|nr:hypothetical protein KC19_11G063600 [Ceratodon purpureus]